MEETATPDPFLLSCGPNASLPHPVIREPVTPAAVSRQERSSDWSERGVIPTPAFAPRQPPHFHLPQEAS
ncbi:hypothetical protein [Pantoea stewartii]|uniref:hypothetical protein n=1 Tax=Pantoea stewartii TaxID=66269 RepID=UPI0025A04230|nr:hypothetical protein [Pantoea stewartii]